MIDWWNGLDLAQQIFALVGIGSTVILLIQTIMLLFGIEDDSDVDCDIETDIGDGAGGDGLALFSIRGIVAMLCVLGWTGVIFLGTNMHTALAIVLAAVCGFVTLVVMAYAMKSIAKLQSSGNIDIGNCIGKVGQVYIPIKPLSSAPGKVNITVQGKYCEFSAITTAETTLKTGSYVRVVSVDESGTLVVEPVEKNNN